ncbi:MAG TPA: hypothetical protein VG078_00760 [Acidimicrobiales bacterium]|nr:hypothetical protein [Acidimicrobiales bacterium]
MTDRPSPAMAGALALMIAVVLGAGVIGALITGDDGDDTAEEQDDRETAEPDEQRPDPSAEQVAEADRRAFDIILANLETCRNRYLPDARARHDQAVAQLREQEAALRRVIDALPPGRAKDSLTAQVGPDFESAIRVIEAELRAVETRCRLGLTVYQLTHDSLPRPVPPG